MEARRKALEIIAQISGREVDSLRPEMDLVGDLGIDSPKALALLFQLEEELEIEISDEAASRMDTVGNILEYVAERNTP